MEQFPKDSTCLSLIREQLDITRGLLTTPPPGVIPEKRLCKPQAAIYVNVTRNSTSERTLT